MTDPPLPRRYLNRKDAAGVTWKEALSHWRLQVLAGED